MLSGKYEFQTAISIRNISQAIKKVSPTCDDVRNPNPVGIYRVSRQHKKFLFFQDVKLPPPNFPCFYKEKEEWDKISKIDEEMCSSFLDRIEITKSRSRSNKKRKKLDDVEISLEIKKQIEKHIPIIPRSNEQPLNMYWTSPEALKLFAPKVNKETVLDCILRRENLLYLATTNDDMLILLVKDAPDDIVDTFSSTAKERMRYQCMYLRKAYEIAIQRMNVYNWLECCSLAVTELKDIGINYIKNGRTIMKWNRQFRVKEKFEVPYIQNNLEVKLFSVSPESRNDIVKYCSDQVKLGSLSVEELTKEIKNNILPSCESILLQEAGLDDDDDEAIHQIQNELNTKSFSVTTAWRWMKKLGYQYKSQTKCYYTDGHEREDVVKERNKFIKFYFNIELETMRWIQVSNEVGEKIETEAAVEVAGKKTGQNYSHHLYC